MVGTIVHMANATSVHGATALYEWNRLGASNNADGSDLMTCYGVVGVSGSRSSCGIDLSTEPSLMWAESVTGNWTSQAVQIWNAPADAKWLLVKSDSGRIVVADVANSVAFAEWTDGTTFTGEVSLLNESFDVVWWNEVLR